MRMPALFIVLSVLLGRKCDAQTLTSSVVNASGNSYSQGYYSFDWSIGEMAIETMCAGNAANFVLTVEAGQHHAANFITNGFLQPNKLAENAAQQFSADEIKILPNPTYNNIEINFLTNQQGTLYINIFDPNGKNVLGRKAASSGVGSIERFDLSHFAAGAYIILIELKPVAGSVKKTGAYKIVKLS